MNNLDDFIKNYIGGGVFFAFVCILIILLFGSNFFIEGIKSAKKEFEIYYVTETGINSGNEDIDQAVSLIKVILNSETNAKEMFDSFLKLKSISSGYFLDFLFNNKEQLTNSVNGTTKDFSKTIVIPQWNDFWIFFTVFSWIIVAVSFTTKFVVVSIGKKKSLLKWPWKKVWTYLFFFSMIPALIFPILVELIIRLIIFICKLLTVSEPEQLIDEKQEALKLIEKIKEKHLSAETAYIDNCLENLDNEEKVKEERVTSVKNFLAELGRKIKETQRELARSENDLEIWKLSLGNLKNKSKEDFILDFKSLLNLKHVAAVKIEEEMLYIYTDVIYIDYFEKKYEIGIIVFCIDMINGNFERIENLCSTHPQKRHHPYTYGCDSDEFCFGELSGTIDASLKNREFCSAVCFILQAICSAEGDKPDSIKEWKEV